MRRRFRIACLAAGLGIDRATDSAQLIAVLSDRGQTGARNAAATALAQLGPAAVPALLQLLEHADGDQRKFAADILGDLRLPAAVEGLVGRLAVR